MRCAPQRASPPTRRGVEQLPPGSTARAARGRRAPPCATREERGVHQSIRVGRRRFSSAVAGEDTDVTLLGFEGGRDRIKTGPPKGAVARVPPTLEIGTRSAATASRVRSARARPRPHLPVGNLTRSTPPRGHCAARQSSTSLVCPGRSRGRRVSGERERARRRSRWQGPGCARAPRSPRAPRPDAGAARRTRSTGRVAVPWCIDREWGESRGRPQRSRGPSGCTASRLKAIVRDGEAPAATLALALRGRDDTTAQPPPRPGNAF